MYEVEFNTQVVHKYTATHTLPPKNKNKNLIYKTSTVIYCYLQPEHYVNSQQDNLKANRAE